MTSFDYLIVGTGMTADSAARGIREIDGTGSIGLIGDDPDPPYTRPALTKKLWTDPDFEDADNWLNTAAETGAEVRTGETVTDLDVQEHAVTTGGGERIGYGKLLLATGGAPRALDIPHQDVIAFRTFGDYYRLRGLSGSGRHIAVVGGSFIGTELAAALVQNETRTTLIYPDEQLGAAVFPQKLAGHFEETYARHGVQLIPRTSVEGGRAANEGIDLDFADGSGLHVDAVVSGLGIQPAIDLAAHAGLEIDDGIVVDTLLRTSADDVFAAGDVAQYPDARLGWQRVEHVNNATHMGAAAGCSMAGGGEVYDHTPYFYSDVFDISYRAVGSLDASLQTLQDWVVPMQQGTVYYLAEDHVAGVLLWNMPDRLEEARDVVAGPTPQDPAELTGRIQP